MMTISRSSILSTLSQIALRAWARLYLAWGRLRGDVQILFTLDDLALIDDPSLLVVRAIWQAEELTGRSPPDSFVVRPANVLEYCQYHESELAVFDLLKVPRPPLLNADTAWRRLCDVVMREGGRVKYVPWTSPRMARQKPDAHTPTTFALMLRRRSEDEIEIVLQERAIDADCGSERRSMS
jgi:hypothetical protein